MSRKFFGNIDCRKIYPIMQTKKEVSDLKTVAFQLTRAQAVALATNLLNAARNSDVVDVTGFRARNLITVTSPPK